MFLQKCLVKFLSSQHTVADVFLASFLIFLTVSLEFFYNFSRTMEMAYINMPAVVMSLYMLCTIGRMLFFKINT